MSKSKKTRQAEPVAERTTERADLMGKEARTARLRFPDETATVKILEILYPFSSEQQELILACVAANRGYPRIFTRGFGETLRTVEMAEPLASSQDQILNDLRNGYLK